MSLSRREALLGLALLATAFGGGGCALPTSTKQADPRPPAKGELDPLAPSYEDNVDALFDVLIPAERDEKKGTLISPGAREAKPNDILSIDRFAALAVALGFLQTTANTNLSDEALANLGEGLGDGFRATMNANLDALALLEKPLTPFRDLSRAQKEIVVARAFDDEKQRPLMLIARAAAFFAYLGAVTSDVGLVAIGYPAFEDLEGGIAISGYPTKAGEDYTFDEVAPVGVGDDLSAILDANGDLV